MLTTTTRGIFIALAVAGCAPTALEARQAAERRDCEQSLEVFPAGTSPGRAYRIVGPVEAAFNITVEGRFKTLKVKACERGAQALIDYVDEQVYVNGSTTTTTDRSWDGETVTVQEDRGTPRNVARAMAIAYVAVPPTPPGPPTPPCCKR